MSGYHTKGKLRPHIWLTGPDPIRHEQYHCWQMHKAQCKFRQEEFTLTFEQYEELWQGRWLERGRTPDAVCMTRLDWDGAWELGNVELITRKEHFRRQGAYRVQRMLENRPYPKSGPKGPMGPRKKSTDYVKKVKK